MQVRIVGHDVQEDGTQSRCRRQRHLDRGYPGTRARSWYRGRSVAPKPVNARKLGRHLQDKLRPQLYETSFLGLGIMAGPNLQAFLHATRSPKAFAHASWRVGLHVFDLATRRQGMQLVNGPALIARLLQSADDLGVELWVSSPAKRLLIDDGAVQSAVVDTSGGEVLIEARTGRLFPGDGELPLPALVGALPAGAPLAIEAPVADLAGRTIGERTRLAHAALIGLLARADPSGDRADMRPRHGQDRIGNIDTASPNLLQTHPKDPGDRSLVGQQPGLPPRVRSRGR